MISLCTMVMNRPEFIKKTLPTWLKFSFDEIVIIDWSSTPALEVDGDERVRLLRVDGREKWIMNLARNTSIQNSKGDIIMLVDCDVKIKKDPTKLDLDNVIYSGGNQKGLVGTCIFKRNWFEEIGGYNEDIKYYGKNCLEFYRRMKKSGKKLDYFENGMIEHIDHDNDIRIENMGVSTLKEAGRKSFFEFKKSKWNSKSIKETVKVTEVRR